jgi:hypothetical protein
MQDAFHMVDVAPGGQYFVFPGSRQTPAGKTAALRIEHAVIESHVESHQVNPPGVRNSLTTSKLTCASAR